jgi:hypothetical protein
MHGLSYIFGRKKADDMAQLLNALQFFTGYIFVADKVIS